ncbi:alkaline phosphatase family protein [Taibaiella soli]|uniref:Secretion system C-terminal sorting domain-containing protein n=1 Tax=Taibaiella soli TaxID=1649169 RepID=A0A2W2A938_9BACT|nr:alkaline phosphatase family protein [Taibaiella soli]PZF71855.1 hypothetical protein DN068_17525 [Taibaiella soli]
MKKSTLFAALLAMLTCTAFASQKRKVLILGLDGVRSDALQQATTPHIDSLIAGGFYTYDSWCLGITVSGPSWSTIFTGVWYPKHGVTDNSFAGSNYNQYPYFPKRAKELLPNINAVQIVDWSPMSDQVYNEGYDQKIVRTTNDLAAMLAATQVQLQNPNLDVLNLHVDNIDAAGHASGFSPSNAAYMSAIQSVDTWVGQVMAALRARPNYANEDWLVFVITDHGGLGTSHGGNSNEERHIWWIATGENVQHKQITAVDPGSYNMATNPVDTNLLKKAPTQSDIAVTALHHLIYSTGIRPDDKSTTQGAAWNLDGKSWLDSIMVPTVDTTTTPPPTPSAVPNVNANFDVKIYPNPATNLITLWFDPMGKPVSYAVTNAVGQVVKEMTQVSMQEKLNIDLGSQPAGNYFITVIAGDRKTVKQVVLTK